MPDNKLILFDYDGVLVNSMQCNLAVVKEVCNALGYPVAPDLEYCRTARCISFESWARHICMSEDLIPIFLTNVLSSLKDSARTLDAFPQIPEAIRTLSQRHSLAIITGNTSTAAFEFVSHHNLNECFLDYSGDENVGSKRDKIKVFMEKFKFSPETTYYVGDAGTDVEEGRAAGVKTIAVTWGFQGRERLLDARPDFIVDSPDELVRILA